MFERGGWWSTHSGNCLKAVPWAELCIGSQEMADSLAGGKVMAGIDSHREAA